LQAQAQDSARLPALITALVFFLLLTAWLVTPGHAVPSYARQTGMACSNCHTNPPELTPFGRQFKLNGYTVSTAEQITVKSSSHDLGLNLLKTLPLSAMFQASLTETNSPQPGTQNGSVEFPQQASLFLSGAWTDHLGSFAQVTYSSQGDHFSWDNTDIRYANQAKLAGKPVVYGLTFNNSPTVEDLWNSTPAWGFPFAGSDTAPSPAAATLVDGTLAQDVAGAGGYTMWNNHLYLAATAYRSSHLGLAEPNSGVGAAFNIRGVAPYWRAAWQQQLGANDYLEVGSFGLHTKSTPGAVTGLEDSYTDTAFDFQYEHTIPQWKNDVLTVRGTYIHENSALDATFAAAGAAFLGHHLDTSRVNATYHFGRRYSGTFGWFDTTGNADPLLYPAASVSGSANGDPHSTGYIANVSWWPIQNIDVALQYTGYTRFNGGSTNYDGSGRDAGANNTVYALLWFIF
jgi:hypothetical protein